MKISMRTHKEMTMKELKEIIREGRAYEELPVSAQIAVKFEGREELFDVIGHDKEKMDKHSVTIQAHRLIGEEMPFDEEGRNIWETSSIRAYMNSEELMSKFEAEFIDAVAAVKKENNSGEPTEDKFFLLSKDEIVEEGVRYPYYDDKANRSKQPMEGYSDWYWTRSASRGYASNTWSVSSSGYVYVSGATSSNRFAPACVIA